MVVLYREPWGRTPWTGVEQVAIQDRCLKDGFKSLFFMTLDKTSRAPDWLPHTHIRFNYVDFGLEQAAGAIKARVQESGGTIAPLTPQKRVELYQQEQQYLEDKRRLLSLAGREIVKKQQSELFTTIQRLCAEINAGGRISIEFRSDPAQCHLRASVSLLVSLAESDSKCELAVREYDGRWPIPKPGGGPVFYPDGEPRLQRPWPQAHRAWRRGRPGQQHARRHKVRDWARRRRARHNRYRLRAPILAARQVLDKDLGGKRKTLNIGDAFFFQRGKAEITVVVIAGAQSRHATKGL